MFDKESGKLSNPMFDEGETVAVVTTQKGKEFLDYLVPKGGVTVGAIVKVPIRKGTVLGIVWSRGFLGQSVYKKKEISQVLDLPSLQNDVRDFLRRSSEYNIFSLNTAIRLSLNPTLNLEIANTSYGYELGGQKIKRISLERKRVLDVLSGEGKGPLNKVDLMKRANVSDSVIRNLEKKGVIKKLAIQKPNDFSKIETSFSNTLSKDQKQVSDE